MTTEDDEYINTPTHVRVWCDGDQWFIDGADNHLRYTESCWSYNSHDEAMADVPSFVTETTEDGVVWSWDVRRPHDSRHLSQHSAAIHHRHRETV